MTSTPDQSSPAQQNVASDAQPIVVIDQASKTYTVRSASTDVKDKTLLQRLRGTTGVSLKKVQALKPLSLVVSKGESVGVIGTNGSGKSTLMKMLTGHFPPTTGSVFATSTPIMLGVNAALVRSISGSDNITLGCLAMGMTPEQVKEKRPEIIELSGLEHALDLPLRAYSSGMGNRLQFAIATSVDPEILIIDEALNTGDAQFRAKTSARIAELREQAGCVFLVSHSMGTIREMTTRTIWIEQGELIMDGDPTEVTKAYSAYTKLNSAKKRKEADEHLKKMQEENLVRQKVTWTAPPK